MFHRRPAHVLTSADSHQYSADRRLANALLALAAMSTLAAQAVMGIDSSLQARGVPALAALLLAVGAIKAAPAVRSIAAFVCIATWLNLTGWLWQPILALTLALFIVTTKTWPSLSPSKEWCVRGRLPWLEISFVAGVTPVALVGWIVAARPDLSDIVVSYGLRDYPLPQLALGAVVFVGVNAFLEELVWRGVLQDRLNVLLGPTAAIALQGLSFGLQHWHGVPRGAAGALLASTWGLMLGWLRRNTGGIGAPFVAHLVADAVIATLMLAIYR